MSVVTAFERTLGDGLTPARDDRDGKLIASDGLVARTNGIWGKEKLSFLDQYMPIALRATESKLQRYYVDLFAGPGLNIDRETLEEFEGGAIRALKITDGRQPPTAFTHLVCVNLDPEDHAALTTRVERVQERGGTRIPRAHCRLIEGNANSHARFIMRDIHPLAYVVVFADPASPSQLPFSTLQALRTEGHRSVDLYVLYPSDMALRRLLGNPSANHRVLTSFYGGEEWRALADERITDAQFPALMRALSEHYMLKLRELGWTFVRVAKRVRRNGTMGMYDMIFATSHPAGHKIGDWAADKGTPDSQLTLL